MALLRINSLFILHEDIPINLWVCTISIPGFLKSTQQKVHCATQQGSNSLIVRTRNMVIALCGNSFLKHKGCCLFSCIKSHLYCEK